MVEKVYKIKDVFNLFAGGDVNHSHFSEYKTSAYIFCVYSNSLADHGLYGYTDVPKYSGDSITITGRGSIGHAEYRPFDFDAIIRLLVLIPKYKDIIDSRYVTELINSYVKFPLESTGVPQLTVPQIENIEISLPTIEVQRKIANALSDMDSLISSLEKLIAKYKFIKAACLQQMFPQNGETVPRMRLPGFTDAWEQCELGELALFNPKDELPQTFEYVDLESVVGTEMLSHRTEAKSSAPSRAQRLAHTGDLFYQTVRPYQRNNYLFEKPDNNYVFSTGYAQMRPYVDGYFLLSLVQSDRFVKVVLDNCTGTSYPAINANDLAEIEVTAPLDENEAQKIGTIFRSIDNLITLYQRKLEKVQKIKQGMMQQLLTGKIRLV